MLEYSQVESQRFGLKIFRGTAIDFNPLAIKEFLLRNDGDVGILRLPTTSKVNHWKLLTTGFPVIHADTLVYYVADFAKYNPNGLKNDLIFQPIDEVNKSELSELIPLIFEGYQNHYFSNPYLDKKDIIKGYIEWAESYVFKGKDKISWYVKKKDETIGFATCSFNLAKSECEGVLYGVHPNHSGGGVYSDIIRFTQQYFKDKGYQKMFVSTQVQNFAVQKVWTREGFYIKESFDTYHINALLSDKGKMVKNQMD